MNSLIGRAAFFLACAGTLAGRAQAQAPPGSFTYFWLSAASSLSDVVAPPPTESDVPRARQGLGSSATLYLWAKPPADKNLAVWSVRLVTEQPELLSFTGSTVYNPLLGTTNGSPPKDVRRWEFINEPENGQHNSADSEHPVETNSIEDLQGFSRRRLIDSRPRL